MIFLLKIIIYPLSIFPLSLIRILLIPIKIVLKYILKYREGVVLKNLHIAFPTNSAEQQKVLLNNFYDNLYFLITESVKSFTMPEAEAAERMKVLNPQVIDKYAEDGQSVLMVFGHFNNWEWTPLSCASQIKHQITAIYQPLKNKAINDWIMKNRSRTGVIMMSTKETKDFYANNQLCITNTFIADQSPSKKGSGVWVDFFGRKTLFLVGAAKTAIKEDHPVLFIDIQRVRPGFYEINIEQLAENPRELSVEEITQRFASRLEKQIKENPGNYLWSHNRWKHSYKMEENLA